MACLDGQLPAMAWGTVLPCSPTDMALFRASTTITLGDGAKSMFWHDHWHDVGALKHRFPGLFKIATRKCRSVQKELSNGNWMRSLQNINTQQQLTEFVDLWTILLDIELQTRPDSIRWRWTTSGIYSAASAYHCQFVGCHPPFETNKVWTAHAEPKCKFFAWVVAHEKIWTSDNLAKRGWPHSPICKLCHIHPETVQHLCHECSFTTTVRGAVLPALAQPPPAATIVHPFDSWWDKYIQSMANKDRKTTSGIICYILWGVWKERNRRIFNNVALPLGDVVRLIREEIVLRAFAHTDDPGNGVR